MPDLLAHALIAYGICRLLAWRYDWIGPAYVTAGMAGAFVPDLVKIYLVVPSARMEALLGVPFEWQALGTGGAAVLFVLIGATVVVPQVRRRTTALIAVGAASHLVTDALLLNPTGRSYAVFWPLTRYHPPTPGLYLSTQVWPTLAAGAFALAVWATSEYVGDRSPGTAAR